MKNGYLIKIVPPAGYRVFRLEFTRRHIAFAIALLAITLGTIAGYYVWTLHHAEAGLGELRSQTAEQRARLRQIDKQATRLDSELHALRTQNDQIRRMIGVGGATGHLVPAGPRPQPRSGAWQSSRAGNSFAAVAARIDSLRRDSSLARSDGDRLRRLALRVLNMQRLENLARARVLAAIPSLNPAGTAAIASAYGWRAIPWPEFHKGVDLDASYGEPVRAAAAGTVVAADYDGGYGIKVDIDHGNGYHTWYCHLSRADVHPGQYVKKAEHIALVGSTGASTGAHLHYQIMLDGIALDPAPFLGGVPERVLASLK